MDFLFLHDSVLIGCIFPGTYPLLVCPSCWHIILIVVSYDPSYFCGISCNVSSFISDVIYMSPLSFLVILLKGLSVMFIFSKNQLSFDDVFYCSFSLYFIFSTLIFVISFLLLTLVLVSYFCSYLRYILKLSIWDFLFLYIGVWTSLLELLSLHLVSFSMLYFHFNSSQGIILFLFWFLFWSTSCSVAWFLISTNLEFLFFCFFAWLNYGPIDFLLEIFCI